MTQLLRHDYPSDNEGSAYAVIFICLDKIEDQGCGEPHRRDEIKNVTLVFLLLWHIHKNVFTSVSCVKQENSPILNTNTVWHFHFKKSWDTLSFKNWSTNPTTLSHTAHRSFPVGRTSFNLQLSERIVTKLATHATTQPANWESISYEPFSLTVALSRPLRVVLTKHSLKHPPLSF